MPLAAPALKTALQTNFGAPGATIALCAAQWAAAVGAYATGVIPASTTVAAAQTALQSALATAFGNTVAATTATALEAAFAAFAGTVSGGMAPAFVGTPPAGTVGFAALFTPPFPADHATAAQDFADAIDAWMTSGTAVPAAGGAAVQWG